MDEVAIQIENVGTLPSSLSGQKECEDADIELGIGRTLQKLDDSIPLGSVGTHSVSAEQLIPTAGDAEKSSIGPTKACETAHLRSPSKGSTSLHSSWHNGALSSLRQIGSFVSTTKLFWVVVVYTIFGAYLFMWLEVPRDLEEKRKAYEYHLVVRDALLFKIEQIHKERLVEKSQHWKNAILEFEQHSGFQPPQLDTVWTLWMSILYCATIYTTVGYGNIACATTGGRVATIVYAICGIPLMIVVLDQLGTFLLRKMKELSNLVDDLLFFLGVKYRLVRLDDQEAFVRYIAICRILARLRLIPNTITLSITEEDIGPLGQKALPSGASTSSRSSSAGSGDDAAAVKICKASTNYRERVSLRLALSRGSILHNIGPFYIESIDADGGQDLLAELDKQLLLPPATKCQKQSERRASKASGTTVQIKLEEADKVLLDITRKSSSRGETSRKTSAAASTHSEAGPNKAPQLGKSGRSPPLAIALAVTTAWIAFAAAVFCLWEKWSYFTSVYFFFISMSTIGFGDVTPEHPQYMIMTFFVVVVGLSLVSVCISVVQEKVSLLYMDFLNKMLQYMKAKESGDVEALKGAMAGFNDRCKYLMPFISKNQGIRMMNKFKEEAKAMGVELPEVMTELNEETGKPAFCKIFDEKSEQKVNQFLEQAQQQGKMRRNAHTQTKIPLPKTHKFFISKAEADKEEFEAQTETDATLEKNTQTMANDECSDSGVQCSPIMADEWTECVADIRPEFIDRWTSTKSQAVTTRNTGVQPEVSCIMRIIGEDESDFPLCSSEDEEDDDDQQKCADALSSSGFSRLGSPADALSSSQQSQLLSGSSREGELERRLSVSSKRSAKMKRMPEIELDDDGFAVEEGSDHSRKIIDLGREVDNDRSQEVSSDHQSRETGRSNAKALPETVSRRCFARPLSPPPLVTIRMASKAPTEEEMGEETKGMGQERTKKRRKMRRAGIRYMKNTAIQVGSVTNVVEFGCQFDNDSDRTKSEEQKEYRNGKEKQQMMVDKGAQWSERDEGKKSGQSAKTESADQQKQKVAEDGEKKHGSAEAADHRDQFKKSGSATAADHCNQQLHPPPAGSNEADEWRRRRDFGVQTAEKEFSSTISKCKRTQTDRPLLVSRPAQTQLTSTFRRSDGDRGEGREGGKTGAESEAQIEPHFGREKERAELKRVFGLENEDIDELRKRVMQMKRERREERHRRRRETPRGESGQRMRMMNSSSEEEEQLDEEDKQTLINEIEKLKRRKRRLEEDRKQKEMGEEEETEEEVTALSRRKGKGRRINEGKEEEQFTLQISHPPAERAHIIRENYEETILDIQLIRSPFFETRYLPQSEERKIYEEIEMGVNEPKRTKRREERVEIEQLLNKLNKLEALSAKDEETKHLESIFGEIGQMSWENEEEIGQFTAESAAQTVDYEWTNLWGKNSKDLTECIDEFKQFSRERSVNDIVNWDKWTQTEEQKQTNEERKDENGGDEQQEGEEEEEEEKQEEEEEEPKRRRNVVERVVAMWRGRMDGQRGKTTAGRESRNIHQQETDQEIKSKENTHQEKQETDQEVKSKEDTHQEKQETDQEIKSKEDAHQQKTDQEIKSKEETHQEKQETDQEIKSKEETHQEKQETDQEVKSKEDAHQEKQENDQEVKSKEETHQEKQETDQEIKSKEETHQEKQETDQEIKSKENIQQVKQKTETEMNRTERTIQMIGQIGNTKGETDYGLCQIGTTPTTASSTCKQRLIDLSQIVLVQSQPETVEFRKIQKQSAIEGGEAVIECGLMPLEEDELAKLQELFPELLMEDFTINAKGWGQRMGEGQQQKEAQQTICSSIQSSSTGAYQIAGIGESRKEQKHLQMISKRESVRLEGKDEVDRRNVTRRGIRLIPLLDFLEGTAEGKAALSQPMGIQPWPIPPGPPEFGHSQLHYFRHWIENLLELARDKKQPHSLYDVPLRSISEFLRERRRELDELERQKQQLERLAELASREEIADRMVNVSIQAGVQSRVVPIMGAREEDNLPAADGEFNYLTNPTYPIVRIPLELTNQRGEDQSGENKAGRGPKRGEDAEDQ